MYNKQREGKAQLRQSALILQTRRANRNWNAAKRNKGNGRPGRVFCQISGAGELLKTLLK